MSNLHNIKTSIPDMPVQGSRLVLQGRRRTRLRLRIFHSEKLCLHQKYLCFPGKLYNTQNVSLGQLYQLKQYRILGFYLLNGWPMSSLHWLSWRKRINFVHFEIWLHKALPVTQRGPGGLLCWLLLELTRVKMWRRKSVQTVQLIIFFVSVSFGWAWG